MSAQILHGDCREMMATLDAESVDAIVTDPPYGLLFMGKGWDRGVPGVEFWTEAMRVAKPGAHLLAFGGTRTYHRLAVAIEDAGWEIRDCVMWVYGSGFPKSLDVSKAMDRMRKEDAAPRVAVTAWVADQMEARGVTRRKLCDALGVANQPIQSWSERNADYAVIPTWDRWLWLKAQVGFDDSMDAEIWRLNGRKGQPGDAWAEREVLDTKTQRMTEASTWAIESGSGMFRVGEKTWDITAPATDAARQWSGWGTALKPAWEPIIVARKPLSGTVAENVLRHGTGAINVDGCRVGTEGGTKATNFRRNDAHNGANTLGTWDNDIEQLNAGRWPANLIHDGSDEVVGLFPQSKAGTETQPRGKGGIWKPSTGTPAGPQYADSGSAARFFYCAKAGKADREGSTHPTMKPTDLMRYLCRLVTPPGGLVLDPFCGSGSTGKGAVLEGLRFVGIEREAEYVEIARARIASARAAAPLFARAAE